MINMIYMKKQFKRRRLEKSYEVKPIGSTFKIRRIELKMTLEETAEGICSISYLSKLENNLIEPNELFVRLLRIRLNLKEEDEIDSSTYQSDLERLLECMLSEEIPSTDLIYKYRDHLDQQSLLIMMCYHSLTKNQFDALKAYDKLKTFIPSLNDFEATMFSISLSMTLHQIEYYQTAYDVLKIGASHPIKNESLRILTMKWTLLSAFKMIKIKDMTNLYEKFLTITTDRQYFQLIKGVNLEYYKLYSVYEEPEKMKSIIESIRDFSREEKDFIYAKSLFAKKQYEKLYPISQLYSFKDSEWFMLHLICLDSLKKEDELKRHLDRSDQVICLNETCTLLIKHIKIKYKKDKHELLRYLRNDLLSNRLPTDNHDTIEYLMTDASKLFSDHQFYKEASQIAHDMTNILRNLKMDMQYYDEEE